MCPLSGLSLATLADPWVLRLVFLLLVAIQSCRYLWSLLSLNRQFGKLPTVPTSPILGTLLGHLVFFWNDPAKDHFPIAVLFYNFLIGTCKLLNQKKENLFTVQLGPFRHLVFVINAKAAKPILSSTKHLTKASEYEFVKGYMGEGLVTGTGRHWMNHRKLITPQVLKPTVYLLFNFNELINHCYSSFHFDILKKFIPMLNSQIDIFSKIIESKLDNSGKTIIEDVCPLTMNLALDSICLTAMGAKVNAQKDWIQRKERGNKEKLPESAESAFVNSAIAGLDLACQRIVRPWLYPDFIYRFSSLGIQFIACITLMSQFAKRVIAKQKMKIEEKLENTLTLESSMKRISEGKRMSFLDLLLVHYLKGGEKEIDLIGVEDEVKTFMGAATDTTSATLELALMLIGLNLDKQELIHQELDNIYGNDTREITFEDTKKMIYLEMCIKETLRLYPTVPFYGRTLSEDLIFDQYLIPAGANVYVLPSVIHRDPEWYPEPEHFLPERFSPGSSKLRHPYAYLPFSAGPRNCIGKRFAMLQMKLFLASLFRQYRIRSLTKQDTLLLHYAIVAKPITPIQIEFTKRGNLL